MKAQEKFSRWCETIERPILFVEKDNTLPIISFFLGLAFMALACFTL